MEPTTKHGHIELIHDTEMYYEIRGEGEPLLLLHGGGGIGANWDLIFETPPAGYRLVIPDLRGHGRSTNPAPGFTFRQLAHDVLGLLDRLGVERFQAVGLSAGAKTLLHMATQQPDRIEAMVLVSATPYFPAQARAIMSQLTPDNRSEAEWQQMREWHRHGDEQIRKLWRQMHALKDSYDDMNFTLPYLSTITARTLIVHGDRDPLYPVRMVMEMHSAIPGSHLWIVPNGGHGPIFDRADHFAETALAFLRGAWAESNVYRGRSKAVPSQSSRRDSMASRTTPGSVDQYIGTFSPEVQAILERIRQTVRATAPDAEETISYQMPTFKQGGVLIHFAAFKSHIGVYPPVAGDAELEKAIAPYAGEKGNLRFPFDQPIPYDLIERIVKLRVEQNRTKAASKGKKAR